MSDGSFGAVRTLRSNNGPLTRPLTVLAARDAEAEVRRLDGIPQGLLRISVPMGLPPIFAEWMAGFLALHANAELEFVASATHVDLMAEGFDLALRRGPISDQSLIARVLSTDTTIAVASPGYLARAGTPSSPDELEHHDCIVGFGGNGVAEHSWPLLDGGAAAVSGRVRTNDMRLRVEAARQSQGIALVSGRCRTSRRGASLRRIGSGTGVQFAAARTLSYLTSSVFLLDGAGSPDELERAPLGLCFRRGNGEGDNPLKSFKIERAVKVVSLSVAMATIGIGVSGCDILKALRKTQKHAAIAYDDKTGGWGYSFDQLTEDLAQKAATRKCSTCTVHLTWNQGCGALAQSKTDKKVMSAKTGKSRSTAEGAAKADCLSMGAGPCKVAVWACNSK